MEHLEVVYNNVLTTIASFLESISNDKNDPDFHYLTYEQMAKQLILMVPVLLFDLFVGFMAMPKIKVNVKYLKLLPINEDDLNDLYETVNLAFSVNYIQN